jgi:hypothetical protein
VRAAYEMFGQIASRDGFVSGGAASVNHVERRLAAWPMFSDPPGCWMHRDGSESPMHWPTSRPLELAAFRFPRDDEVTSDAAVGRVYMVGMLSTGPRFVASSSIS